jgi:hypothetical protein
MTSCRGGASSCGPGSGHRGMRSMPSSGNRSVIRPVRTVGHGRARGQPGVRCRAAGRPRGLVRPAHDDRRNQGISPRQSTPWNPRSITKLERVQGVTLQSRIVLRTSNIPNCTPGGAVAMGASNGSASTRCPCASPTKRKACAEGQCHPTRRCGPLRGGCRYRQSG